MHTGIGVQSGGRACQTESMQLVQSLLRWRSIWDHDIAEYRLGRAQSEVKDLGLPPGTECKWCRAPLLANSWEVREAEYDYMGQDSLACPLCGWTATFEYSYEADGCVNPNGIWIRDLKSATLLACEPDNAQGVVQQLSEFARENPQWINGLSPTQFERLIANLLSGTGYSVKLTQQTRDGGIDVFCIDESSNEVVVVECKHRPTGRTVGVQVVREMVGAMVDWKSRRGKLVTSGFYSRPAGDYASRVGVFGFEVDLVDLDGLLLQLDLYQAKFLRMGSLGEGDRRFLIAENVEALTARGYSPLGQ